MSVSRISTRYAKSLVDLAQEQNKLNRIKTDIDGFLKATENRDFELMVKSPVIPPNKKQQVFNALFKDNFDEMTMAFLDIVVRKNRAEHLEDIAQAFVKQYQQMNKVSTITLTTATALTEEAISQIEKKFLESSDTSEKIDIISKVNPDLIGGFVVEFDDKLYDASVAHKLEKLKKEFAN
jgi:F-type H+-transporting ATPase subunit delta